MPKGIKNLQFSFGESNLTHIGGIFLIHRFCQKLKLKRLLQTYVKLHQRNERYQTSEIILIILYIIIAGIHRINNARSLKYNGSLQRIIGLKKFPDPSVLRRFLHRLPSKVIRQIVKVHNILQQKLFCIPHPLTNAIFDMDPTVLTVYGKQQRAKVGFNPKHRGKRSYCALLCFEEQHQEFWLGSLRSGNVSPVKAGKHFFKTCLEKLPPSVRKDRVRLRADSGFFSGRFIELLDDEKIGYTIEAQITSPMKQKSQQIKYHRYKGAWEVGEFYYQPTTHAHTKWKKIHRFVVERRPLPEDPEERHQLSLWEMKGYGYRILVTNLLLKPQNIWNFHNQRARGAELMIKELKINYPLAKIPTRSYTANISYFQLLMFAFNIVNWFKRICLPEEYRYSTLQTIRDHLLIIPARLLKSGHRNLLKFPKGYPHQDLFNYAMTKIKKMKQL